MPTFYNFRQDGLTYSFDDIFVPADFFRAGNLWNWGRGVAGALGNYTGPNFVSTPTTTFVGSSNWKQVSTGGLHTVAIKTDGTLWVWGSNTRGQLGNANTISIATPITTFAGGTNWKQAEGGTSHTIAIKTDGTLWTWGMNDICQLGINAVDNISPFGRSTPVTTFAGGTNWKQIAAGYDYSAAIKTDGTLWTWGYAYFGELGNTRVIYTGVSTPITTFAGGTDWKQVSCGYHTTAALKTDGTLWMWGAGDQGQLGSGIGSYGSARTAGRTSTPITTFAGGNNWKQVSSGGYYSVTMIAAIKTDGTLWTWGNGYYGILGNGVVGGGRIESTPITTFAGGTNWKQVSTGGYHMSAVKTNGTLWTWGSDVQHQLGIGYQSTKAGIRYASTPVTTFIGGTNWKSVGSSGGYRVCAIQYDDILTNPPDVFRLFTWGYGGLGALGNARTTIKNSTPSTTFAGGTNWKQISSNAFRNAAAIKTDGTLWVWGYNRFGQLGNASTIDSSTPVTTFAGGTNWNQLECGGYYIAAIKTDGTLWTWGYNGSGQLGDTKNTGLVATSTPVTTFAGGTNWKQVSCGYRHNAAIKTDGTLWSWGRQDSGYQLGIGYDGSSRSTPVTTFAGGTNWKQVSCGYQTGTGAIKTDGTLWVWGEEIQLGNAATGNRSTPVTTFAGGTNWKQISSGGYHTAAIKTDGTLWTWGYGSSGRLGNATTTSTNSTPITTFTGGTNWKQVDAGRDHTLAIKADGTLWTWGYAGRGSLGTNDTTPSRSTPVTTFAGGTNWEQVSAGPRSSGGVTKN